MSRLQMIMQKGMGSVLVVTGTMLLVTACGSRPDEDVYPPSTAIPPAKLYSAVPSVSWSPDMGVVNASVSPLKVGVTVQKLPAVSVSAGMVRLNEAWGNKEVLVPLGNYNASDFGQNGSITLQAEVSGYSRIGGAYAVLTSFYVDTGSGIREYVNLSSACKGASGVWACSNGSCYPNLSCQPVRTGTSSSFFSRNDWEQHQFQSFGYGSTNSFPRCDAINGWDCAAGLESLPTGAYYAKYILMSDSGASVSSVNATLNVTPIIRTDSSARGTASSVNGGIKLNVILVGSQNINDSRAPKGQQNLNLLFKETHKILKENAGIGIDDIQVYEWRDADGGDYYSQVSIGSVGYMFASATQTIKPEDEGKYINVFMVRDIQNPKKNGTILGVSGGILGAATNGTQTSGLVFATHGYAGNRLTAYNPGCGTTGTAPCPRDSQDEAFIEMGATIAHELGHYLGLNHLTESGMPTSQKSDQLSDTPTCSSRLIKDSSGAVVDSLLDQLSCYVDTTVQPSPLAVKTCAQACDDAIGSGGKYFAYSPDPTAWARYTPNKLCPAVQECQFNHTMWYTTKNHLQVNGVWVDDGNQFSPQSQAILQWNAFVQ